MKSYNWMKKVVGVLVSVLFLFPLDALAGPPVRTSITTLFANGIRDADGNRPSFSSPPDTLLFRLIDRSPLPGPDGRQLTWGEWIKTALTDSSRASVKCINKGTHVLIEVTDLIPNALYSVWLFARPNPTVPIGGGALPSLLSDSNGFTTDETGAATINAIVPAASLSISGEITSCLFDNSTFVLQIAYHSDNQLYGGVPGPTGITFDHINFVFQQP